MRLRLPAVLLAVCLMTAGQTALSVEQLIAFIKSSIQLKQEDRQVASFLSRTKMTERLDDRTIEELQGYGAGLRTVEALKKLRDASTSLPQAQLKPLAPAPSP